LRACVDSAIPIHSDSSQRHRTSLGACQRRRCISCKPHAPTRPVEFRMTRPSVNSRSDSRFASIVQWKSELLERAGKTFEGENPFSAIRRGARRRHTRISYFLSTPLTTDVVNSRVSLLCRGLSARMGTGVIATCEKALAVTRRSKRADGHTVQPTAYFFEIRNL
jgi:hypothetical protein